MRRSMTAGAAAVAAALLVVSGQAGPAAATPAPARHAAKWLVSQQSKGIVTGSYGADYGLSIDLGLALDTIGGHRKAVRKVRKAIAENVAGYTTDGSYTQAEALGERGEVERALDRDVGRDE